MKTAKSIFALSYALLFFPFYSDQSSLIGQNRNTPQSARQITLSLKPESKFSLPNYRSQADSAIKIAEAVFNSTDFQNTLSKKSFNHSSYCRSRTSCKKNEKDNGVRIAGQHVLGDLFKEQNVSLALYVETSGNKLGSTCPGEYAITMYYDNIMEDMKNDPLPPSYKLAVNLCHEYMHQLGYCHLYNGLNEKNDQPDPRYMDHDVSYTVG